MNRTSNTSSTIVAPRRDLCIDFVNTRYWRGSGPVETVHDFSQMVRWCDMNAMLGREAAATQAFLELVDIVAAESGKTRPNVARRRALVAAATIIGALTMSRIVTDSELSAGILREAEKQLVNSR